MAPCTGTLRPTTSRPERRRTGPAASPAPRADAPPGPGPDARTRHPRRTLTPAPGRADGRHGRGARRLGGARRAGAATGRGIRRTGTGSARAATYVYRQARRASHAEGAGESGLARLIELHAFNAAGDAAVAISLAGTLFFQVPTNEARGQVALFLGLTMLPFAIVAPLIGPVLDRFSHGRRWALGSTMAIRAFLCWVLATEVTGNSIGLFPAALGVLVASKAYGVTRAAAVPRLTPPGLGLVKANSRISLAGMAGAGDLGPAGRAGLAGRPAVVAALRVRGLRRGHHPGDPAALEGRRRRRRGARASCAVVVPGRRCRPLRGPGAALQRRAAPGLGLPDALHGVPAAREPVARVGGPARDPARPSSSARPGVGNASGIALGSLLREVKPAYVVVLVLVADTVAAVVAAALYSLVAVMLLGLVAGLSQALGKLSLDSLIQTEVPERTRSSAFARSETLLQLSWVVGGFLGIAMPLIPRLGLGVLAVILLGILAVGPDHPCATPQPSSAVAGAVTRD